MIILPETFVLMALAGLPQAAPAEVPWMPSSVERSRPPMVEFPERALMRGVESGEVVLTCAVLQSGGLEDCRVISEDPAGMGFGQAAIAGAKSAWLSQETVRRAGEEATVTFTVRFHAPAEGGQ